MTVLTGATCLSGIVVRTTADRVAAVAAALAALPGVEVYRTDVDSARIVIVQEAASIDAETDGMRRIQALPGVIDASLVYHYFGDAAGPAPAAGTAIRTPFPEGDPS
jgi:nitrate reductase NapD